MSIGTRKRLHECGRLIPGWRPFHGGRSPADADPEGRSLGAGSWQAQHRSVSVAADGSFVHAPAPGFSGSDSFTYRASDGALHSLPVVVTIPVAVGGPTASLATTTATVDEGGGPPLLTVALSVSSA